MEQRRMTGSGMWTNFFAGVLAAIAFSPVCLSAAPELATANGNDTAITQNSVQMLEPEYFKLGIKCTDSTVHDYSSWITSASLVGVDGVPEWKALGPSIFSDGTVASQVYSLNFWGYWEYINALTVYDEHFHASSRERVYCSLQFALTEDEDGHAKWRIFEGALPMAIATPDSEIYISNEESWPLCFEGNNDLNYEYRKPHAETTTSASQTLTISESISDYPVFVLLSDNISKVEFSTNTNFKHIRAVITLETGAKEPGMEDVTILDPEL